MFFNSKSPPTGTGPTDKQPAPIEVCVSAPPPSYDSLFGRREVCKSYSGFKDFFQHSTFPLTKTICCDGVPFIITVMSYFIKYAIPLIMIVVGINNQNECPYNKYIPVFLQVLGGLGVLRQLLRMLSWLIKDVAKEELEEERTKEPPSQKLLWSLMLGWIIIGSCMVYGRPRPSFDRSNAHYCNKSLYVFTVGLVTSVYISIFFSAVILCVCCVGYKVHQVRRE